MQDAIDEHQKDADRDAKNGDLDATDKSNIKKWQASMKAVRGALKRKDFKEAKKNLKALPDSILHFYVRPNTSAGDKGNLENRLDQVSKS